MEDEMMCPHCVALDPEAQYTYFMDCYPHTDELYHAYSGDIKLCQYPEPHADYEDSLAYRTR